MKVTKFCKDCKYWSGRGASQSYRYFCYGLPPIPIPVNDTFIRPKTSMHDPACSLFKQHKEGNNANNGS